MQSLMHAGTESCTGVNINLKLILISRWNFLPGRLDQNITDGKRMEKAFPVIDPVLILCIGAFHRPFTDIYIPLHFRKHIPDFTKKLL